MGNLFSSVFSSSGATQLPSSLKVFPEHLKASAVISISDRGESCQEAIETVLSNHKFFKDLHIVYFAGKEDTVYYEGWLKDLEELKALGLEPIRHSTLNLQKLGTLLKIDIPPDMDAGEGAFYMLLDTMAVTSVNEMGVVSDMNIDPQEQGKAGAQTILEAMFAYGFLLVLLILDSMRSAFRLFQYHRTNDLRATRLSTVYPGKTRAPTDRWWMWWIFTGVAASKRGGNACIQRAGGTPENSGLNLLIRTVKTHRYMSWTGVWLLAYLFYYLIFAYPWWNGLLSEGTRLGDWLIRDVTSILWITMHIVHLFVVGCISWIYMEVPYKLYGFHVIFYPFFLTLSPLVFFLSKIAQVKKSSQRRGGGGDKKKTK